MTENNVYTLAGVGTAGGGGDGVVGSSVSLNTPTGVSVDFYGNVRVADQGNHRVLFLAKANGIYFGRTMTANGFYVIAGTGAAGEGPEGTVATLAGLQSPTGVATDLSGNLYVTDTGNHRVLFVSRTRVPAVVSVVGGNGRSVYDGDNEPATDKSVSSPTGVFVGEDQTVYVTDANNRIRLITDRDPSSPAEERSVSLVVSGLDFGGLTLGLSTVSVQGISITNTGSVASTYEIKAEMVTEGEGGTPWRLGEEFPASHCRPLLLGAFHPSRPTVDQFEADDILGTSTVCDATHGSIDGSQTGFQVPPGEERLLWFRLDTPPTADQPGSQTLNLTITAGP